MAFLYCYILSIIEIIFAKKYMSDDIQCDTILIKVSKWLIIHGAITLCEIFFIFTIITLIFKK